jgi:hypothetical protein
VKAQRPLQTLRAGGVSIPMASVFSGRVSVGELEGLPGNGLESLAAGNGSSLPGVRVA